MSYYKCDKNLQFVLEYINQNPGCKVVDVRFALMEKNGIATRKWYQENKWCQFRNNGYYMWYFQHTWSRFNKTYNRQESGAKKGYDYGYWVNTSDTKGKSSLLITENGIQRLNKFLKDV